MEKTATKKKGPKPRFRYKKRQDTFFSSQEMEQYYKKRSGDLSLSFYIHNVLLNVMQNEISNLAQAN